MRTNAAGNIPCALVRPPPSVSGAALRDASKAPSGTKQDRAAIRADTYQIEPRITCVDRAIIRGYFHQHDLDEPMQPAWKKNLFPESYQQLLPPELESRLSVLPAGYRRMLSGCDVLLIDNASRTIIDVMRDIGATLWSQDYSGPSGHMQWRNRPSPRWS